MLGPPAGRRDSRSEGHFFAFAGNARPDGPRRRRLDVPLAVDLASATASRPVSESSHCARVLPADFLGTRRPTMDLHRLGICQRVGCHSGEKGGSTSQSGSCPAPAAESTTFSPAKPAGRNRRPAAVPKASSGSTVGRKEGRSAASPEKVACSGRISAAKFPGDCGLGPSSKGAPANVCVKHCSGSSLAPLRSPTPHCHSAASRPQQCASARSFDDGRCRARRAGTHYKPCAPSRPQRSPEDASGDVKVPPDPFPLDGAVFEEEGGFTFDSWVSALPRLLASAKTQFGSFVVSTLSLEPDDTVDPSTALFPLPCRDARLFQQRPARSQSSRQRLSVLRCTHLIAMSLNFVHAGCRPVALAALRRPVSPLQCQVYERIGRLVRACARQAGVIPSCAGRRGLHVAARLAEVLDFLRLAGFGGGPYEAVPPAMVHHMRGGPDALRPYGPIKAEQVALHGRGTWNLSDFLDSDLNMPYREPEVLRFEGTGAPCASFEKEDTSELLALCKIWDRSGLLGLTPGPLPTRQLTRVFAARKAQGKQRQIGDRRGQNSVEAQLVGPSRFLPTGPQLCMLTVPRGKCLVGCVTDRKDFYTQASVTAQRRLTNAVGPSLSLRRFVGTAAFDDYVRLATLASPAPAGALDFPRPPLGVDLDARVHPTFGALFQGDSGGVEFATGAHEGLLLRSGCLLPPLRLQGKHRISSRGPWQGLIIDDFFSLSVEEGEHLEGAPSEASSFLARAASAYERYAILGSTEKDVINRRSLCVAGASIDSSPETVADGATIVAYPVQKRLSLAAASLRAATLPAISEELAAMLSGSWVACLLYRRPLMSVLDGFFALGRSKPTGGPEASLLRPLTRKVAGELQVLAVLAPIICSNISAGLSEEVFATDASMSKGAVVSTTVPPALATELWLSADFRGQPVRLDGREPGTPASKGQRPPFDAVQEPTHEDDSAAALDCELRAALPADVKKPLACHYDCIVIGPGAFVAVEELQAMSLRPGPAIDFGRSSEYDLCSWHLRDWLVHIVTARQVGAVIMWPALPSFCPASHGSRRSLRNIWGNRSDQRVSRDNCCAATCLLVCIAAARSKVATLLVQPGSSLASRLPAWKSLSQRVGAADYTLHGRDWGPLRCLSIALPDLILEPASAHGALPSRWPMPFVRAVGAAVKQGLDSQGDASSPSGPTPPRSGLESVIVNDLLLSAVWSLRAVWSWARPMHINLLEALAALQAVKFAVRAGGDRRLSILTDSSVARGALAKGRSSSVLLRRILLKAAAWQIAGGIYTGFVHAPTALNIADDPTRMRDIRPPVSSSLVHCLDHHLLADAFGFSGLSSTSAAWIRLSLLLAAKGSSGSLGSLVWALGQPLRKTFPPSPPAHHCPAGAGTTTVLEFDATKGYPGEGPLGPRNPQDLERQRARAAQVLPEGRLVLPRTRSNRTGLLEGFFRWLETRGYDATSFAALPAEEVGNVLAAYGRDLFDGGRPYWHYAETINGVVAQRPALRKQVQIAWDLAYSWMQLEPYTHHVAMPAIILIAVLAVCLTWGWRTEAGIFAMAWGALLRIGEATTATRSLLVLPRDVLWSQSFALVVIPEPKTRLRTARHQSAKLEAADLVQVVDIAFRQLSPGDRLWPASAQTLRRRLDSVLERLHIPTARSHQKPLDLGSFRPGGATYILHAELVRRRGRWASGKVMEIYLQEVSASTFYPALPAATRKLVFQAASAFPSVLQQAASWTRDGIPTKCWYSLWAA